MNGYLDQNAERIAEISRSEHVWNLFLEGELSSYASTPQGVLEEARGILEKHLKLLAANHRDRVCVESALERLKNACQSNRNPPT